MSSISYSSARTPCGFQTIRVVGEVVQEDIESSKLKQKRREKIETIGVLDEETMYKKGFVALPNGQKEEIQQNEKKNEKQQPKN